MNISITNTLTKAKETFTSQTPGVVNLYVCGITPYDYAHIGHGRVYVTFDLLLRLLKFAHYHVTYVRNITDIDDKLLNKARAQGDVSLYTTIAQRFINAFHHEMHQLNCLSPDYEPRVTECIPEIITFIQELITSKHAYIVGSDVYFDIVSYKSYGKLSGKK